MPGDGDAIALVRRDEVVDLAPAAAASLALDRSLPTPVVRWYQCLVRLSAQASSWGRPFPMLGWVRFTRPRVARIVAVATSI